MVKKPRPIVINRRDALVRLVLVLVIIVLVNIVSNYYYVRLDLTAEKRYSILKPTRQMLKNLNDEVTVRVYLDGELNAGFKELQETIKNTLKEFRAYAGKNITYEFIDPMAIKNLDQRKALITDLISKGLPPTNLKTQSTTDSRQQLIFPGALVAYGGREIPVNLLENQIGQNQDEILQRSMVLLEYKLASAISKLIRPMPPQVGFVQGHGELDELETADIRQTLQQLDYSVQTLNLKSSYYIPAVYDAIVIAKPKYAFDDTTKFKIDQYIMRGGKVLWVLDGTNAEMDSLRNPTGAQFAQINDVNLDDMLFKYGVRVNGDLVQDINLCGQIPAVVGMQGGAPQTQMFPWYYFPLLVSESNNPIVKNLNPVEAHFASSIDTMKNGIEKTILLHSTEKSKAQMAPTRVNLAILYSPPNPAYYNQPALPVAVLLQGEFESLYKNRVSKQFLQATDTVATLKFYDKSVNNKMIVVADGDIMRNDIRSDSSVYPLGFDRFTGQTFANKDFVLNCLEYLVDNSGILQARNKEVRLRLLNKTKVADEELKWQLLNTILPIVIIILFGIVFMFLRRRKYTG